MNFVFTKEQRRVADAVKEFAQKELFTQYARWDREKVFPREIWKKSGELGLIGMTVSLENGGLGLDCMTQGIAAEEMAKGDPNMASATYGSTEVCVGMLEHGTEIVKNKFLLPVLEGALIPALALTEPHCGTDAAAITTKAIKKGTTYIIDGEKTGITLIGEADVVVVLAKTDPDAGARGVSAFVVPVDSPGIKRQRFDDLGGKCLVRGSIFFDEVEIPEAYLLGKEGEGFKLVMKIFDGSRVYLALLCIGTAMITLKETIAYTKERHVFKKPLAKFEGVSFPIVEHLSLIEAVRLLCYKALWLRDNGKPHTIESAMVKAMAPKFSVNAIHDCLILHGHYGYTEDLPIAQRLRDVMGLELGDGTTQVSNIVIAREIFGREYLPY
jgi:cyclohexanecarboxyl-CoA dehydrogenase